MNLDKRVRQIVERIDAEKVTVSITYDRHSWWHRRGRRVLPFEAVVEWEDDDRKFRCSGEVDGGSIVAVLDAVEAEVNGVLLRERAATDG